MNRVPLRYVASLNRQVLPETTDPDLTFRYVDISAVDSTGRVALPEELMTFAAAPSRARRVAPPGATAISTVRTYLRAIACVPESPVPLVLSTGFAVAEAATGYYPRFLYYACRSDPFVDEVVARSVGVSYPAINPSDLAAIPIPSPTIEAQRRIADFLDDQVARIDNIIDARQRQADLLDEAFLALAEATLWPRAIPPTWAVDRLNRWAKIGSGSTPRREDRSYWEGGEVPWLNSSVVNLNEVIAADQFVTDHALAKCHLPIVRPGSVLVGLTGEGRTRGMATLLSIPSTINQHLAFVTGDDHHWQPGYLLWALRSAYGRLRYISDVNGSTKGGLTCGDLGDLRIPRPSLAEQVALLAEIEELSAATRSAREALRRSAGCLGEFKRSLITAAVTGQFDVSTADGSNIPS